MTAYRKTGATNAGFCGLAKKKKQTGPMYSGRFFCINAGAFHKVARILFAAIAAVISFIYAGCDAPFKQTSEPPKKKIETPKTPEEAEAAAQLEKTDIAECLSFYDAPLEPGDYATAEVFISADGSVLSAKIKSLSRPNKRFENCLIKTMRFQKVKPTGKIMNIIVGIPLK